MARHRACAAPQTAARGRRSGGTECESRGGTEGIWARNPRRQSQNIRNRWDTQTKNRTTCEGRPSGVSKVSGPLLVRPIIAHQAFPERFPATASRCATVHWQ